MKYNYGQQSIKTTCLGNVVSRVQSTLKNANGELPDFEVDIVRDSDNGTGSQDVTLYTYDKYNRLTSLKQGDTTKYNLKYTKVFHTFIYFKIKQCRRL